MFDQYPDMLTVESACEILNMSKNTLYKLLNDGEIKCFRQNRIWKIPRQSVELYCLEKSGLISNTSRKSAK